MIIGVKILSVMNRDIANTIIDATKIAPARKWNPILSSPFGIPFMINASMKADSII